MVYVEQIIMTIGCAVGTVSRQQATITMTIFKHSTLKLVLACGDAMKLRDMQLTSQSATDCSKQ